MKRACNILLMPRGRYSSMLDMGGVQQAGSNTSINVGKNLKIRAIALDFDLITRSIESSKQSQSTNTSSGTNSHVKDDGLNAQKSSSGGPAVEPNQSMVKSIANLLNVNLNDGTNDDNNTILRTNNQKEEMDDLSLLIGDDSSSSSEKKKDINKKSQDNIREAISNDIRTKYADKLRLKVEGGLAGVELANHQRDEAMKRGDATTHLNARNIAASTVVSKTGSKWLATTGTGSLLSFLNSRSMKIALMPLPIHMDPQQKEEVGKNMDNLSNQLPNIKFDLMIKGLDNNEDISTPQGILNHIVYRIDTPSINCIVVSDRDDILRTARDKSMYTCRVRKKNQPRGNVTTDYTVEDISGVEDVINEVNGISFNTVFSRG